MTDLISTVKSLSKIVADLNLGEITIQENNRTITIRSSHEDTHRKNLIPQSQIKQAIDKGIFNEIVYGFWINQDKEFKHWGVKGIPLSPDILFLISDEEKSELEEIIKDKL